ncbi:Reticuline oxidase-like protein [Hordeum vulgare]|nr:Reticuline oxidase-like protein [Hordeum vulgare]
MAQVVLVPYGGQMSNVSEDATPFPHRVGVLYSLQLYNYCPVESGDGGAMQTRWFRDMYAFMAPYVSSESKPRGPTSTEGPGSRPQLGPEILQG